VLQLSKIRAHLGKLQTTSLLHGWWGKHLHKDCPEKGNPSSTPTSYNGKLIEGETAHPPNYRSCRHAKGEMTHPSNYRSCRHAKGEMAHPSNYRSCRHAKGEMVHLSNYRSCRHAQGEMAYPTNYRSCGHAKEQMQKRKTQKSPKTTNERAFSSKFTTPALFFAAVL
jgi:hypothetical protein